MSSFWRRSKAPFHSSDMEIRPTDTPSRELLLLADESEASVNDYLPRSRCYAAFEGGQIIGQYLLLHTRPFTAEVVNIAVVPDRQRQGVGTALLQHAIRSAREAGFRILEIEPETPAPDRSPSTNGAGSSAAALTSTTSASTTRPRSSKTGSNAATWYACAWICSRNNSG